eukprot:4894248-Pyramimonas_sp.AAC.2
MRTRNLPRGGRAPTSGWLISALLFALVLGNPVWVQGFPVIAFQVLRPYVQSIHRKLYRSTPTLRFLCDGESLRLFVRATSGV